MFISRKEYKRLCEENKKLRERYEELKFRVVSSTHFLDDFEYAVLLSKDTHTLKVWNQGRFEENVVSVKVGQEVGCIPYLKIEK